MSKQHQTPMSGPVSHLELCHALHTLHRASIAKTWIFKPLAVDLERKNAEVVYVAYLEERLYIFREGNAYRMAYGSNPLEAYVRAYEKELKASEKPQHVKPARTSAKSGRATAKGNHGGKPHEC